MKFKVDEGLCIGCGMCANTCEDVFKLTDDGFACVKKEEVTDEKTKEEAITALENCPTDAISKEE